MPTKVKPNVNLASADTLTSIAADIAKNANKPKIKPDFSTPAINAMTQQYTNAKINTFDAGRLINDNPLSYLGFQNTPRGTIGSFTTPLNTDGITITQDPSKISDPNQKRIMQQILREAGLPTDAKAIGSVLLGPNVEPTTEEHEMMHRGMEIIKSKDPNSNLPLTLMNEEVVLRLIGVLNGNKEDANFLKQNNIDPKTAKNIIPDVSDLMKKAKSLFSGGVK